jgi:hypothetical protein
VIRDGGLGIRDAGRGTWGGGITRHGRQAHGFAPVGQGQGDGDWLNFQPFRTKIVPVPFLARGTGDLGNSIKGWALQSPVSR